MAIDLRHYDPSDENKVPVRAQKKASLISPAITLLLLAGLAFWFASLRETNTCFVETREIADSPYDPSAAEGITFTRGSQNHYFRENAGAGEILIITGLVRNSYADKRSFIRLRGHLLDATGRSLAERYVYAGNILSEEDLRRLPINEIRDRLSVRGGQDGLNQDLEPGTDIPFMLVFDRLPEAMAEYRVDPVGSFPSGPAAAAPVGLAPAD